MRPTGKLHIGHYFGALENWVRLQNARLPGIGVGSQAGAQHAAPLQSQSREYDCFYFIADWHALTSDYADTSAVAQNTIEIVTDYLASGLDPEKSVIFQQSLVPEHAELHLLLSMVTPLGWLERVPTYKEALENVKDKDLHNYWFLGYPVLQCADIVIYSAGAAQLFVPVGEDQVSHVELSREIVRRFNFFFGFSVDWELTSPMNEQYMGLVRSKLLFPLAVQSESPNFLTVQELLGFIEPAAKELAHEVGFENFLSMMGQAASFFKCKEILTEPGHMLTHTPRIPGLDGRKMSKSYGNTITLSETDEEIRKKTKVMVTDPARKRRTDPGNPDVCPVYDWHKLFSSPATQQWAAEGCRTAGIGCIECKAKMADHLIEWIAPKREARLKWEANRKGVLEIIDAGSKKARVVAQETMGRVREAVFGWTRKREEVGNGGS